MLEIDSLEVRPALKVTGDVSVPGDKSISHRLAMIGSLAEGTTTIRNFAASADCASTLECLRRLGVALERDRTVVRIPGRGLQGWKAASQALNAENSGTTVRLMAGLAAGFAFESTFIGDASLSRRPMKRIIDPLRRFGAVIQAREDNYLPMSIKGGGLTSIDFRMPIPSAQVKSAVLFAGLHARGLTRVQEPAPSRNHTELALQEFGARITARDGAIEIEGGQKLHGREFYVPGDLSSAAFFIAAALCVPDSELRLRSVGLNPTRSGFLTLLRQMRARVVAEPAPAAGSEPAGDIVVKSSDLEGCEIGGDWIPNIIDEIPILAVIGTQTDKGVRIQDAAELRAKESDRIHAVAANLRALGATVEEYADGLYVPGRQTLRGGIVDSFGDHRIAMAFAVAGLFAEGPVLIKDPGCVAISFPGFFEVLRSVSSL